MSNAAGIDAYFESTEFGVTRTSNTTNPRYAWLGGKRRDSGDALAGVVLMGARLYSPNLGRFLQIDPVPGGSANGYDYCAGDPVNCMDLAGTYCCFGWNGIHYAWWGMYGTIWFYLSSYDINFLKDWWAPLAGAVGAYVGYRIGRGAVGIGIGALVGYLLGPLLLTPLNWASEYGARGAWVDVYWREGWNSSWAFGWYDAHA